MDESKTSIQFNGGRKVDKKFTSWNKLPPIRTYKQWNWNSDNKIFDLTNYYFMHWYNFSIWSKILFLWMRVIFVNVKRKLKSIQIKFNEISRKNQNLSYNQTTNNLLINYVIITNN